MQRTLEFGGPDIVLDTENDTNVFLAARPESVKDHRYKRGKDLFVKTRAGEPDIYYIYRWTYIPNEQESIHMISRNTAERFLEKYGLHLGTNPEQKAGETLRSFGYGILEEF